LPSRLVFRPEHRDYGIDGEVEEFDEADEATGRRFRVQLKATGETGAAAMRERIKLDTAAYYRAQHLPVLMVRYVAFTRCLYGRWFHAFDPYYEHVGETHLTFHWSESDQLTEASFDQLFADVERIIRLKTTGLQLPLTVALEVPGSGVHGCARAELELALEAGIARYPSVLERVEADEQADVTTAIDDNEVRANVSGLASVTFHLDDGVYSLDTAPEIIAADALSCIAVALARAGHGEPAARIAVQVFADSLVSAIPAIGIQLAVAMVEAGRVVEVIDLAERLDQDGEEARETCGGLFMEAVRARIESLQTHEHERFEVALRDRLKRRLDAGRNQHAAASAENVGRHFMTIRRPWDAVEFLEQAVALDPSRETADVAQQLAGAYFLSGQYARSVLAYERALELAYEPDPDLEARRADALMYAGRYRQALEAFGEIETDDTKLSAWVYVKTRALSWVIETTGIEEQEPNPEAANELAGRWRETQSDEDADVLAAQVWELDAASSLGWFNRARDLLDRGLEGDAMHAYLTAAVMREGDVEAWVNIAILAVSVDDPELFAASAITGARLNKDSYMAEFMRQLRATVPDVAGREEMLALVRQTIQSAT
jgi:tetratricopeptide (TPR) repeat protein